MVYIMVYTMIHTMAYTISCTFSIYHAPEKARSKGPQTENAVGLFDFPPGGLSCYVGHIGLQEFQELHCPPQTAGAAGHSLQPSSQSDVVTSLHVPLQCSQVDLNQLVTQMLNEWQTIQGGIWSSSVNTGINIFDLQHFKVNGKEVV
jgi:hypothetical protein